MMNPVKTQGGLLLKLHIKWKVYWFWYSLNHIYLTIKMDQEYYQVSNYLHKVINNIEFSRH